MKFLKVTKFIRCRLVFCCTMGFYKNEKKYHFDGSGSNYIRGFLGEKIISRRIFIFDF